MARTLCPDRERASIASLSALIILFSTSSAAQVGAIAARRHPRPVALPRCAASGGRSYRYPGVARRGARGARGVFHSAHWACPSRRSCRASSGVALFDAFYRSGALVFGGGHVVLPLLREAFVAPGWVSDDAFLAGYGAAQAVPGPLFTFAAYLGAVVRPSPHGIAGRRAGPLRHFSSRHPDPSRRPAVLGSFRKRVAAQAAMRGVNAAVVGLLGAALYNPLWTSSVKTPGISGRARRLRSAQRSGACRRCWSSS